jgi:2'-5' RNA ligase
MLDRIQTPRRAAVTWLGASRHPPALENLVRELRLHYLLTESIHHPRFTPHVTLARQPKGRTPLLELEAVRWPAREFALMQSQAHAAGSQYSVVARWPLVHAEGKTMS